MKRQSTCLFGCGHGDDGIEHYSRCRIAQNLSMRKLAVDRPPANRHLDHFLLLEPKLTGDNSSLLARRALALYSTFMATNRVRKGLATNCADVWTQFMKEAAASHSTLLTITRSAWSSSPSHL